MAMHMGEGKRKEGIVTKAFSEMADPTAMVATFGIRLVRSTTAIFMLGVQVVMGCMFMARDQDTQVLDTKVNSSMASLVEEVDWSSPTAMSMSGCF